ncbi:hypothetical protein HYQ44_006878 [Verticillium longisporum]|nr:hypothetical protein HYQ44_006878 [Verticillium longisporum]
MRFPPPPFHRPSTKVAWLVSTCSCHLLHVGQQYQDPKTKTTGTTSLSTAHYVVHSGLCFSAITFYYFRYPSFGARALETRRERFIDISHFMPVVSLGF